MSDVIRVDYKEGDLFGISVRNHILEADQPIAAGGTDAAPTPTELFVVSLAACVAFYVRRFLTRHSLPTEGLSVGAGYTMAEHPARVGAIDVSIDVPLGVSVEQRARLLAVASHCTVHNTLERAPRVSIELATLESAVNVP